MKITDAGFQDFRQDASCLIRPQSLLGEKYVDCEPDPAAGARSQPPPPLKVIPDGQPGAGQHFLPLENNGQEVDLDLVNNIMREPYADRFRLILNDLGAGLAARGKDLEAIIERADPALRETDRVLADARRAEPAAGRARRRLRHRSWRRSPASASTSPASSTTPTPPREATAERSAGPRGRAPEVPRRPARAPPDDGQAARLLRRRRRRCSRSSAPARPRIARATEALGPFAHAATPALITLGTAAAESQQPIVNSDPILRKVRDLAKKAAPGAKASTRLLASLRKTGGYRHLTRFLFNTTGGRQRLRPVRPLPPRLAADPTRLHDPGHEPSRGLRGALRDRPPRPPVGGESRPEGPRPR